VLTTDSRIEHVLQNLLSNAIKYRRKGVVPEIHVSAKREGDTWRFAIQDNGIGIDPRYKESIFQVFHRLHGRDVPARASVSR
jgi:light-regulated signal transduction histidine kinase (bacteriophytochrome)